MTSEEIIQRLLDEKKITVKEAMIILKDLSKIWLKQVFPDRISPDKWTDPYKTTAPPRPWQDNVVVMYGVLTNPVTYNTSNTINSDNVISSDEIKNNGEITD